MKRFFSKIGRFFWSWGFLKFILWSITIIVLIFVEENWRGARDWAATKAKWEAKGESFGPEKFFLPKISNDQNLGALPLFKIEWTRGENGISYLAPVVLQKAMRVQLPGNKLPPSGNWQEGELPDVVKIKFAIAANYVAAFPGQSLPAPPLEQFDALYPFLSDLRAAAVERPYFRLASDFASDPFLRPMGPVTAQISLSKILSFHAILALDAHESDLALKDIKLNTQLMVGEQRDPSLVAGLVVIGMRAIFHPVISYGLALHAWNDVQLADLQSDLAQIDFLSAYQFSLRGELATESIPNIECIKKGGGSWIVRWTGRSDQGIPPSGRDITSLWPNGWLDQNIRQLTDLILTNIRYVDPATHRVFADQVDKQQKQLQQAKGQISSLAPWNILIIPISAGPLLATAIKSAQAQVYVDETRIACGLERYRLAHGAYPGSLEALVPTCIPELPHDVIDGEPYRYHLRPDGTYLLYSVGWNQIDDGGKMTSKKNAPAEIDYNSGDWVWPTPEEGAAK